MRVLQRELVNGVDWRIGFEAEEGVNIGGLVLKGRG